MPTRFCFLRLCGSILPARISRVGSVMKEKQDFWQRFSGYLVLTAVILLLFLLGRLAGLDDLFLPESGTVAVDDSAEASDSLAVSVPVSDTKMLTEATLTGPLPVLRENTIAAAPNPHTYQAKMPSHNFHVHTVTESDTPNKIAEQYGISADTLIGGNPGISRESNLLQTGAELIILPVDGVLHTVQPGETLESIAEMYDVSVADIINFESNNLDPPFLRLMPEAELVIPGASIGQFYFKAPKSVGNSGGEQQWAVVGTGTYIWPVNGRCISQYYSVFHPGLDVTMREGSTVVASDTGTVTYASYAAGVYYDYGNLVVINHGNGFETFYAHLSGINVYPGQIVYQGDAIGMTGNTGRSSGPHIHFEIRNNDFRTNPLDRLGGSVRDCT